jgi:hypothetical protein
VRTGRVILACAAFAALHTRAVAAQSPDVPAVVRFEIGDGRSQSATWFTREPDGIESMIRRVITPVKLASGDRVEVFTDIEVSRNKATIRRSSEKRVFSAADMRPISSRIDVDYIDGAAQQSGWRELAYSADRVKGQVLEPRNTPKPIEKELPAGSLIAPGIAFTFLHDSLIEPGRTLTFRTYNENTNGIEEAHIKIVKRENVTVAGNSYDAWKVEIKTGRTNATAHYTTTIPRVLLRLKDNQVFQELFEMSK